MKYIYVYPVDGFERGADNETIIRAWKEGEAQRYTPELFAETINDEAFCDVNNWVRVIDEDDGYFEISSLHRNDLEHIGYDTRRVDDSDMKTLASKLGSDYCEQLFWSSLPIIADHLGIPKKRKRRITGNQKLKRKTKQNQ
jgi:hypothetical protein